MTHLFFYCLACWMLFPFICSMTGYVLKSYKKEIFQDGDLAGNIFLIFVLGMTWVAFPVLFIPGIVIFLAGLIPYGFFKSGVQEVGKNNESR